MSRITLRSPARDGCAVRQRRSSRGFVLALAAALGLSAACSKASAKESAASATPARSQDPETARARIAAGATVIDVRSPEEFAAGHLPGAANLPIDQLEQRLGELAALVKSDQGAPIVLYCRSGKRADRAQAQLLAAGYTQVINGGGLTELQRQDGR